MARLGIGSWLFMVLLLGAFALQGCSSSHSLGEGDGRRDGSVGGDVGPGPTPDGGVSDGGFPMDAAPNCDTDVCGPGRCACMSCDGDTICVREGDPCPLFCPPPPPRDAGPGCFDGPCGPGLCACDGCFGEYFCVEPGTPCPAVPCPPPPPPECDLDVCGPDGCGCFGCDGELFCVPRGEECPPIGCPPPPPPPECDLDICGFDACGCRGCEGEYFCIPRGVPCPILDCGVVWYNCEEAIYMGRTGDRCVGNWGCGVVDDPCCSRQAECVGGVLQVSGRCDPTCGDPCAPQEAFGQGPCDAIVGIFWNGRECVHESGCFCEGPDCGNGYMTIEQCRLEHQGCFPSRSCGGFVGNTCPRDYYCDFYEQGCDYADGIGECRPRPTQCTGEWAPVCGCDGVTYVNECVAHLNGVDFAWPGTCGGEPPPPPPPPPPPDDCRLTGCPAGTYCGGCLTADGSVLYVCLDNGTAC